MAGREGCDEGNDRVWGGSRTPGGKIVLERYRVSRKEGGGGYNI